MSAVWGVINLDGNDVSERLGIDMMEPFEKYKIDNYKYINNKNVFMGCGMQYITQESLNEILPFYDDEDELIITADAIIDNREELLYLLGKSNHKIEDFTDSEYILMSYKKWGMDCLEFLVGTFAFAIWDNKKEELVCVRDHVGNRAIYYYQDGNTVGFSTIIKPLLCINKTKEKLNEKWMINFLALDSLFNESDICDTPYNKIYSILPGHFIKFSTQDKKTIKYWNPLKSVKELKLGSDEEYLERFNNLFKESISCRMRTLGEVGLKISGGLDSGSIACVAAELLKESNKELKGYNVIPMKEFKADLPKWYIADEREYIKEITNRYSNIKVTSTSCEGKNSLTGVEDLVDILEQPYRIVENLFWGIELIDLAVKDGCKVIMTGQSGNTTISFGDFKTTIMTYIRKGRLSRLNNEIKAYSDMCCTNPKIIRKRIIKQLIPHRIKSVIKREETKKEKIFKSLVLNMSLVSKHYGKYNFNKINENTNNVDVKLARKYLLDESKFSNLGIIETKISLAKGIAYRDPTRDKRIIEFCLSLPVEQFFRDGKDRYLIRRAMKGILPDKIRLNFYKRGFQSLDWLQRLKPEYDEIYTNTNSLKYNQPISKYIDSEKLSISLSKFNNLNDRNQSQAMKRCLEVMISNQFIKNI